MVSDLRASYVERTGWLDYTGVVEQSDGQGVWSCEHTPQHDPFSECSGRELARRTRTEKGRQARPG